MFLDAAVSRYLRNMKASEDQTRRVREELRGLDEEATHLTRAGLMSSLAAFPGLLSPLAAGMVALPGLAVTGAASFGVFAVALHGFGDAIKAVHSGDPEKLAEALAKLSDQGRRFVAEYQRVKPVLDQIGDATQDAFIRELLGGLEQIVDVYLPTMLRQVPRLASALGRSADELVEFAAAPDTVAKVNRQIDLAIELSDDWTRFLEAALGIVLDLADAGVDFNRGLVDGLADGTESLRDWLAQRVAVGDMNRLLDNGALIIGKIGDVAEEAGELLFDMAANPALADGAAAFLDVLSLGLRIVRGFLDAFSDLPGPMQSTIATLFAVAGAVMLLAGRFQILKGAALASIQRLEATGPAGARAASGLQRAAQWAGRAAAAFAALQIASVVVASTQDQLRPQVDALAKSLERFAHTGRVSGEAARVLGAGLEDLNVGLKFLADKDNTRRQIVRTLQGSLESLIPGLAGTNTSLARTAERVQAVDQALAQLVQSGRGDVALQAFNRLAASQAKFGVSTQELMAMFPQYAGAIQSAGGATQQLARSADQAAFNTAILSNGLAGAVREAGSLRAAFDRLHGGLIAYDEAAITAEIAVDRLTEALKRNENTFKIDTKAGQENKQALIDGVQAAVDAAQAKYNQTIQSTNDEATALREATTTYDLYIGKLREAMLAEGLKEETVDQLLAAYASMPPLIATEIDTPGIESAISRVDRLQRLLNRLVGHANIRIGVDGGRGGFLERWGGITLPARHGLLRQAQVFSPVAPARFAFAEPSTGGEAFIPRNGETRRSMSILDTAASWYGASVVPGGGGGTTTVVHQHHHTIVITGDELLSGFRRDIELSGGDVQLYLGSKRAT